MSFQDWLPNPQITVLDTGGQYCHLIARKVRELGVCAEVRPSETPAAELAGRKGVIISGGPNSVYEPESPTVDPAIFSQGTPVLGICYGLQLMAHLLDGNVRRGEKGEYGLAFLDLRAADTLFEDVPDHEQVWMSHRDTVTSLPTGFKLLGRTDTCAAAAMGDPQRKLYGVQFHPEVVHTHQGTRILSNFLFRVCGCEKDWDPSHRLAGLEDAIREAVGDRSVFFFVSGGVDSSVAYTLCLRALGPQRVRGAYVDTGLMREGETEFVRSVFDSLAPGNVSVETAESQFLSALAGVRDPEHKRRIIGEEFVQVQERILESRDFLGGNWILGQGTIYPDTIESGGTAKAAVIKTHHNRVPGIQRLMEAGRIVEPLSFFYKDEVREIGRQLGLSEDLLERHPFPGPGLAIRCLCTESALPVRQVEGGWLLPVQSVGVQGDSRSYAAVLAIEERPTADCQLHALATELINRLPGVNRVVALVAAHAGIAEMHATESSLTPERLSRLRKADAIVRRLSHEHSFDSEIWQFPVVLIPIGTPGRPDSVVLRPIDSVDGMTARSVAMSGALLDAMSAELLRQDGICAVFYDLTHKPPGTIEWE
jgi:GMP synthase (glutamine-hydrolysing)